MRLLPSELNPRLGVDDIADVLKVYEDILPSPRSVDVEIDLVKNKWACETELAETLYTPEKVL